MADAQPLTADFSVSTQLHEEDLPALAAAGFRTILNNRPDGEVPGQPTGAAIEAAASAAGLSYLAIPIGASGVPANGVEQLAALLRDKAPVLGFCRSGARSSLLWALLQVRGGRPVNEVLRQIYAAGLDISTMRPLLDDEAARRRP